MPRDVSVPHGADSPAGTLPALAAPGQPTPGEGESLAAIARRAALDAERARTLRWKIRQCGLNR